MGNRGRSERRIEAYYQIFVPSFADSNGDGIGDLNGILSRLDYLENLGIRGIWLSPIHPSPSCHKYDVIDYYGVDSAFGTIEDAKALFAACHARNIRVLLDLVLNCTSDRHPAFLKALRDPASEKRRWYLFADAPQAAQLDPQATWNGLPSRHTAPNGDRYLGIYHACMPDLNFDEPTLREECLRIASYWLRLGANGFRLDSAMHLYHPSKVAAGTAYHEKNIAWWKAFRAHCRAIRPDCLLVGEIWAESEVRAPYFAAIDSSFHFYLGDRIRRLIDGTCTADSFSAYLTETYRRFMSVDPSSIDAPFLSNHDMLRYAEQTGWDKALLKLSAAIYLTLPGMPFVYYGEELGLAPMPGDPLADDSHEGLWRARTAFPFGQGQCAARFAHGYSSDPPEAQERDPDSMLHFYRTLIRLRSRIAPIRDGHFSPLPAPEGVLAYRMHTETDAALIYHNLSDAPISIAAETAFVTDPMTDRPPQRGTTHNSWILPSKHSMICYNTKP
ncbi:MAG: alpha-amylase [Clostridia bacterium]|nr:alpha-amylase [Clostridia bacterium]